MGTPFLRQLIKYAKTETGFADLGIVDLTENNVNVPNLGREKVFDYFKKTVKDKNPWAKSVIVLLRPYSPYLNVFPEYCGVYSAHYKQYPLGRKAAQSVATFMEASGCQAIADSGIALKAAAYCASLGKYGNNSLIYANPYGSFLTLHSIVTDAIFDYETTTFETISDCQDCNLCADACPTKAILPQGRLDNERCLRYHMVSSVVVPEYMRPLMGRNILGCEICQIVCPMNKEALSRAIHPPDGEGEIFDIKKILSADVLEIEKLLEFIGSIIGKNYVKAERLLSSAALIAGNLRDKELIPDLLKLHEHQHLAVRDHAAWGLSAISPEYETHEQNRA